MAKFVTVTGIFFPYNTAAENDKMDAENRSGGVRMLQQFSCFNMHAFT